MSEKDIGAYIKDLRLLRGYSLTELSKKSGVSQPYLSQIESGDRIPSTEILRKLAEPLGVPLINLMEKGGYLESGNVDTNLKYEILNREKHLLEESLIRIKNELKIIEEKIENAPPLLLIELKKQKNDLLLIQERRTDLLNFTISYLESLSKSETDSDFVNTTNSPLNIELTRNKPVELEEIFKYEIKINGRILTIEEKNKLLQIANITFSSNGD